MEIQQLASPHSQVSSTNGNSPQHENSDSSISSVTTNGKCRTILLAASQRLYIKATNHNSCFILKLYRIFWAYVFIHICVYLTNMLIGEIVSDSNSSNQNHAPIVSPVIRADICQDLAAYFA